MNESIRKVRKTRYAKGYPTMADHAKRMNTKPAIRKPHIKGKRIIRGIDTIKFNTTFRNLSLRFQSLLNPLMEDSYESEAKINEIQDGITQEITRRVEITTKELTYVLELKATRNQG